MRITAAFTRALLAFAGPLFFFSALPAVAAINAYGLGASYDSTQSNVIFRVYSSRATRIDVYLYASPLNSPEVLSFPLSANSGTNIFSTSIPVATLLAAGINGQVYYGYRAWGPNWPFSSSWTKGFQRRVHPGRGCPGQSLQSQQAADRPLCARDQP
jgi:isoamylase